jgi:hypothetical protein
MENEVAELRGPALVAWLVSNTETLVHVASALGERAGELAPIVPRERVVDLCKTVRHSALEITVALLALLSKSDVQRADGAFAEAVANAHARLQQDEVGYP